MTISQGIQQREITRYKELANETLLQEMEAIEDGIMQEAIEEFLDKDILASFALRYGLIKNEISQHIAYGSW